MNDQGFGRRRFSSFLPQGIVLTFSNASSNRKETAILRESSVIELSAYMNKGAVASMIFSSIESSDITELAAVHIQCWNETYRGIIPDDYLDKLSLESRIQIWTKVLGSPGHYGEIVRHECRLFAFLSAGKAIEKQGYPSEEIFALYVLKAFQRKNLGRELCTRLFATKDLQAVCAWVLRENPSCQFYERMGGKIIDARDTEIGGKIFQEVLYRLEK